MKNCEPFVLGPLLAMHSKPSESNGIVRSSSENEEP